MADNSTDTRGKPGTGGRIWIVDDEASVARFIGALLEVNGYRPVLFAGPQEVVAAFDDDAASADLLITDQTMPGMTGVALARALWKKRPDLPVILCSGFSEEVDEARALKAGFRGYLQKPLDTTKLLSLVGDVVGRRL